jgi:hypothetical protein
MKTRYTTMKKTTHTTVQIGRTSYNPYLDSTISLFLLADMLDMLNLKLMLDRETGYVE